MMFLGGSLSTPAQAALTAAVSALGNEAFVAGVNSNAAINHFVIPGLGAISGPTVSISTALLGGVSPTVLDTAGESRGPGHRRGCRSAAGPTGIPP